MLTKPFNIHFLLHAATLIEEKLRQRLADLDISPRQARVLDALGRMDSASQADIAREFNITAASMSTMTTRLITAGYITRKTNPNEARSNVIKLTKNGQSLVSEIHDAWRDTDRLIEETVGAENAAALAKITHLLRDGLGGHTPGTPPSKTILPT